MTLFDKMVSKASKTPGITGKITAFKSGGASSASGLIIGTGTSASPATTAVADDKFMEFRCESTATTGDNRLAYLRYELSGTGGGECLRAFTKLSATVGTAHGAHLTLDLNTGADDKVTGLGVGMRGQLLVGNVAVPANGTYFGTQSEIYMAGSTSTLAAVTTYAIAAFVASGDATGVATVLNAMAFQGSAGTGKMIYNNNSTGAAESNGSIRILVDEGSGYVARYIRYWDAENS